MAKPVFVVKLQFLSESPAELLQEVEERVLDAFSVESCLDCEKLVEMLSKMF
jgi:hypothetical protein